MVNETWPTRTEDTHSIDYHQPIWVLVELAPLPVCSVQDTWTRGETAQLRLVLHSLKGLAYNLPLSSINVGKLLILSMPQLPHLKTASLGNNNILIICIC